jgi:hypothetical protein
VTLLQDEQMNGSRRSGNLHGIAAKRVRIREGSTVE